MIWLSISFAHINSATSMSSGGYNEKKKTLILKSFVYLISRPHSRNRNFDWAEIVSIHMKWYFGKNGLFRIRAFMFTNIKQHVFFHAGQILAFYHSINHRHHGIISFRSTLNHSHLLPRNSSIDEWTLTRQINFQRSVRILIAIRCIQCGSILSGRRA